MSTFFVLHLLLSVAFLTGSFAGGSTGFLNDEVLGLLAFKSGIIDTHNSLDSWNPEDEFPCSWRFIECDAVNRRVMAVSLDGLELSGKLGRGLEKLQFLKKLSLSGNSFSGDISPELLLLPNLERLNLSNNGFSGTVPLSFPSASNLQFVDFSMNSLSGPLPDNLFESCSSLRYLSLAGNRFEGSIPNSLRQCTILNHLNLSSNLLSGQVSDGIWMLSRIRTLDLSENALSGSIPGGMSMLYNLEVLDLHENQLSGSVPEDIGLCPHLNQVDLSKNLLNGTIPESLQKLKALKFLSVSDNGLTGYFPQWIDQMSALEYMDFSNNVLTGCLPASMGAMKFLKFVSLSNNQLTGAIPSSLGDSTSSLSVLRLSQNRINGSIPQNFFDKSFDELDLSRNKLNGLIPPATSKLSDTLQVLDLSDNNLSGEIPAEMGILSKLRYFNLSYNQLESSIPPELGYFPNLKVLDFRRNSLIGSIPGEICDSGSLNILQLDGNSLTGPIPDEIANCSSLYLLSLSYNNMSGPIPESLSQLSELKVLRLEVNQLTGEIPPHLAKLENLLIANVSHNRLVGRLPPGGVFRTLDASAIDGNLGICSPFLKEPCMLNVPKPLVLDPFAYGNQMSSRNKHPARSTSLRHPGFFTVSAIVVISAAALIVVGVVVISLLNLTVRKQITFVGNSAGSSWSISTKMDNIAAGRLIFFDSNLSLDLLNNTLEAVLNKSAEIGAGVFGTVYKASVGGGQGTMVAIKKLTTAYTLQFQEEFDREIRLLAKAKHPNLNPLRGYYWTPQLQLVVSEFAAGGNLQTKLHESMESQTLSWEDRFKIILGTAKGLAYLHHSFQPPIIHYNIKPTNILLHENLNPKISDFGLARILTKFDTHLVNNRFRSEPAYVAPELTCQNMRVNEKCDVYGFGVLILELVTGQQPVEPREDDVMISSDHVKALLEQGSVLECVDKRMEPYPEEEVLPLIKLALVCTSQIPCSRPSMAEVVQILQVIKAPLPDRQEALRQTL